RELLAIEVTGEQFLVGLDDGLDQLLPVLPDALGLFVREVRDRVLRALQELPVQEIDRRREVLVLPDRHMQWHDADAVRLAELAQDLVEVGVLPRSEEHTSELQSLAYLVCRLLLEKKKTNI